MLGKDARLCAWYISSIATADVTVTCPSTEAPPDARDLHKLLLSAAGAEEIKSVSKPTDQDTKPIVSCHLHSRPHPDSPDPAPFPRSPASSVPYMHEAPQTPKILSGQV